MGECRCSETCLPWRGLSRCAAQCTQCHGQPRCSHAGKSTLLKMLAGRLKRESGVTATGEVRYNGRRADTFVLERNAAYIDQTDQHLPAQKVYDLLKFAWHCQSGIVPSRGKPSKPQKSWMPSGVWKAATEPKVACLNALHAVAVKQELSSSKCNTCECFLQAAAPLALRYADYFRDAVAPLRLPPRAGVCAAGLGASSEHQRSITGPGACRAGPTCHSSRRGSCRLAASATRSSTPSWTPSPGRPSRWTS